MVALFWAINSALVLIEDLLTIKALKMHKNNKDKSNKLVEIQK